MLHYQHTFLSSNQATELTRLGSIAEPPSKDDIIFKHPRSCMHRQTDSFPSIPEHQSVLLIAPIYQSKKKKETPSYFWDQGNLLSVLHGYLLRRYLRFLSRILIGIQDGHSMN